MSDAAGAKAMRTPAQKWKRRAIWAIVAVVAYTLFGFFVVPVLITKVITPQLQKHVNGTLSVAAAKFNPFTFRVELTNGEARTADGVRLASFGRFVGRFKLGSTIVSRGWHFGATTVEKPFFDAKLTSSRTLNLLDFIKGGASAISNPFGKVPRVVMESVAVTGGSCVITDETVDPAVSIVVDDFVVSLAKVDTRANYDNAHTLTARTSQGETIGWTGNVSVNPFVSRGTIDFHGLDIARFMPYITSITQGEITGGKLVARVQYNFAPTLPVQVVSASVPEAQLQGLMLSLDDQGVVEIPVAQVAGLTVDAVQRTVLLDSLTLRGGSALLERNPDGTLNVSRLFFAPTEATADAAATGPSSKWIKLIPFPIERLLVFVQRFVRGAEGPWSLDVGSFEIIDHKANWADGAMTPPAAVGMKELAVKAGPIRTSQDYRFPFDVRMNSEQGGQFKAIGEVAPIEGRAEVKVDLTDVGLVPLASYLPPTLLGPLGEARLTAGKLSVTGDANAQLRDGDDVDFVWNGSFSLDDLQFDPHGTGASGSTPLLAARSASGKGELRKSVESGISSWTGVVSAEQVSIQSTGEEVINGTIGLASFDGTAALNPSTLEHVSVDLTGNVAAREFNVRVNDARVTAAESRITHQLSLTRTTDEVSLVLKPITLSSVDATITIGPESEATNGAAGTIEISGDATVKSATDGGLTLDWTGTLSGTKASAATLTAGGATVNAERFDVSGPTHVERSATIVVNWEGDARFGGVEAEARGENPVTAIVREAAVVGRLTSVVGRLTSENLAALSGSFTGSAEASGVTAAAATIFNVAAEVDRVAASNAAVDLASFALTAEHVTVRAPKLTADFPFVSAPSSDDAETPAASDAIPLVMPSIQVGRFELSDGSAVIRDPAADPAAELRAEALAVEASNISTAGGTPMEFRVTSAVQGTGRLSVIGTADPSDPFRKTDVTVELAGVPLPPNSAISGRYVGYHLDEGRLDTTIPFTITDGQLNGTLKFVLDRIRLGKATDSPDAPDVPLELGLTLLRDSNDQVTGDIGFSGDVREPNFSLGDMILKAFFSLVGKIITAPFQLLGAAFGAAADQDISIVPFEPGTDRISATGLSNLDVLAKALKERPTLRIELRGTYDSGADVAAMQGPALKQRMLDQVRARGSRSEILKPAEYEREIKRYFRETFPDAAKANPEPTLDEMERVLREAEVIDDLKLRELAARRAEVVRAALERDHGLTADRVRVAEPTDEEIKHEGPAVTLGVF